MTSRRTLIAAALAQVATVAALVASGLLRMHPPVLRDGPAIVLAVLLGVGLAYVLALRARADALVSGVAATAALVALIAVAEEILWRGVGFALVTRNAGPLAALIFTSAGFALAHFYTQGWDGVRTHGLTGAAFGVAFLVSGTIFAPIAMHLAYNLAVVLGRSAPRRLTA